MTASLTGPLRNDVLRSKEKTFLIIETVPLVPEPHMSSGVTWHWLREPDSSLKELTAYGVVPPTPRERQGQLRIRKFRAISLSVASHF